METVSVVIPAYNAAQWLSETIESVLAQSLPPFEVIVVDDGSTDNTQEVLARFRGMIDVISQENKGLPTARNVGIRAAKGSLIAFLDADDIWLPEKLSRQVECFEQNPDVALIHTALTRFRGTETVPAIEGQERFVGNCYAEFFVDRPGVVIPSTIMVRANPIREIGYFDESLNMSEDVDFCLRMARHHRFIFLASPLVLKRLHSTNLSSHIYKIPSANLFMYEKAISEDPKIFDVVDRKLLIDHLAKLACDAAYWAHKKNDKAAARRYLVKSLRYSPLERKSWILLVWTVLPDFARAILTHYRRRLKGIAEADLSD